MKTIRPIRKPTRSYAKQQGATLIITLLVMLALTVVALAVTSSNQTQSIMVRNNQFRLESFNVSYTEIDAQVDALNNRKISDGVPTWLIGLIDGNVGGRVESYSSDPDRTLGLKSTVASTYMQRAAAQEFRGTCLIYGQQAGVGSEKIRCNELEIESEADLVNTSISSEQHQVYEYKTLN